MPTFLLCHRHAPEECRFAFAAWHGFDSPLRHVRALSSCPSGNHALWWVVAADDAATALDQLPAFTWDFAEFFCERYDDAALHLRRGIAAARATGQGQYLVP